MTIIRADRSPVTFQGAFTTAMQMDSTITSSTPVYAVFLSGLQRTFVPVRITQGNEDYKIDKIPAIDAGQVYVVLSKSATLADDENIIAGPAILQVSLPVQVCLDFAMKTWLIIGTGLSEGYGSVWATSALLVKMVDCC